MRQGREVPRIYTPPLRDLTPETSAGFAMIEFARVLGVEFLPWQKWLSIHALELLTDGRLRFRTILVLVARQNGKSTWAKVLVLFLMMVRRVGLVLGTAQDLDLAEDQQSQANENPQDEFDDDVQESLQSVESEQHDQYYGDIFHRDPSENEIDSGESKPKVINQANN